MKTIKNILGRFLDIIKFLPSMVWIFFSTLLAYENIFAGLALFAFPFLGYLFTKLYDKECSKK